MAASSKLAIPPIRSQSTGYPVVSSLPVFVGDIQRDVLLLPASTAGVSEDTPLASVVIPKGVWEDVPPAPDVVPKGVWEDMPPVPVVVPKGVWEDTPPAPVNIPEGVWKDTPSSRGSSMPSSRWSSVQPHRWILKVTFLRVLYASWDLNTSPRAPDTSSWHFRGTSLHRCCTSAPL